MTKAATGNAEGIASLFPGFSAHRIATEGAEIFALTGGAGPPLLLLHGYPQTLAMWHRVAPRLAERFTVVAADLRGYGRSSAPPADATGLTYAKRTMAADMRAVMAALGHRHFAVMGHDRGGRVAYRLALDHPEAVSRLALLDIITTFDQWQAADLGVRMKMWHWTFLAQPAPLPERLLAADPAGWVRERFTRGTLARSTDVIAPVALADYCTAFAEPAHLAASCEDYRAAAGIDLAHDTADRDNGRRIACPALVLWGAAGNLARGEDPLALWRPWCGEVTGVAVPSGHFIPEEAPQALLDAALPFLAAGFVPTS